MIRRFTPFLTLFCLAFAPAAPAMAQSICPPPPNPSSGGCTLEVNNAVIRESDANLDGLPDNRGSAGSFCGGNSGADCVGFIAAEVGFSLVITDPAVQTVTCTLPLADIWIMNDACTQCLTTGFGSVTLPAGSTTDPTLKIVVADINGDVCPCGAMLTCTFDKEADCADGADGDGDGLIDGADPDCCVDADGDGYCGAADCDDGNPDVHELPQPVQDLLLGVGGAGNTRLTWDGQSGAVNDGMSGMLSQLSADMASATCLFNNLSGSSFSDLRAAPPLGDGYFYLLRAQNSCGESTWGRGAVVDATSPCQ